MAKSFTVTCYKSSLEAAIQDFDVMGNNPVWVKNKAKSLLERRLSDGNIDLNLLNKTTSNGETVRMLISLGGAPEMVLKTLVEKTGLHESEVAKRVLNLVASEALTNNRHLDAETPEGAKAFVAVLQNAGYSDIRPEQCSFYLQNKASLENRKIGLSEAATGTGKTVSMLISAAEVAIKTGSRVLIAVPTISLIHQFKSAYTASLSDKVISLSDSIAQQFGSAPEIRSIFGRQEFVSEASLASILASGDLNDEHQQLATLWLENAVKAGSKDPDVWLISSLMSAAGDEPFPVTDVRLDEYVLSSDMGFRAYKRQMERQSTHESEIILATHAMLGVDFRSRLMAGRKDADHQELSAALDGTFIEYISAMKRDSEMRRAKEDDEGKITRSIETVAAKRSELSHYENERGRTLVRITEEMGSIPAYRYLIIDECHQFESSLSRVLSNYVAVRQIERELKDLANAGAKISRTSIKQVSLALKDIMACAPKSDVESKGSDMVVMNAPTNQEYHPELIPAIATIVNVLDSIKAPPKEAPPEAFRLFAALKKDLFAMKGVVNGAYGTLNFSPTRRFPQMTIGRPSIESILRQLWAFVEGASCVSATIYLPKGDSSTAWYLKSVLAIPQNREAEYAPNVGYWIYRPVKEVWQPSSEQDIAKLSPPYFKLSRTNAAEFDKVSANWHQSVAETIANKIIPTAEGGILTLTTSYKTCEEVAKQIKLLSPDTQVVQAVPGFSLSQQKIQFLKLRKEGKSAVWVATGGAWTGLDVSGKDIGLSAEEDDLLTDLVIPRLPFNTNRSITHEHRKIYKPSINWEIFETCFALRQALGRLVRRKDIKKNRRIWMLDGRIVGPDAAKYTMFQKILDKYKIIQP